MQKASRCLLTLSLLSALAIGSVSTAMAGERLDNIMEKKVLRVGTPGLKQLCHNYSNIFYVT